MRRRVVPATIEIIDGMCLEAVERLLDDASLHLKGIPALLLVDVDGSPAQVTHDLARAEEACTRGWRDVVQGGRATPTNASSCGPSAGSCHRR